MEKRKKKIRSATFYLILGLMAMIVLSFSALACEFTFSLDQIEAPIGTVGEIGVRAKKTCWRCVMDDPLDYQFNWEGIQILGETEWEQTDSKLSFVPKGLVDCEDEVGFYYHILQGTALPLLIVSSDFFYRFDHLQQLEVVSQLPGESSDKESA